MPPDCVALLERLRAAAIIVVIFHVESEPAGYNTPIVPEACRRVSCVWHGVIRESRGRKSKPPAVLEVYSSPPNV